VGGEEHTWRRAGHTAAHVGDTRPRVRSTHRRVLITLGVCCSDDSAASGKRRRRSPGSRWRGACGGGAL
jgi:hypothetical protein